MRRAGLLVCELDRGFVATDELRVACVREAARAEGWPESDLAPPLEPTDGIDAMVATLAQALRRTDAAECALIALRAGDAFRHAARAGVRWRPGASAFLDAASDVLPVGIITRLPRAVVDAVLPSERQAQCRFLWCSDEVAPDAAWARAAQRLSPGTTGVALIDRADSAARAEAAGWCTVWLGDGGDSFASAQWRIFPEDVAAALASLVNRPARF
ncbi:MAG: hypothetical protein SFW08_12995 [Gemmatimonadaceae bacterium]|nr:hypothetical protein [Gemmatimonadaceae bacterium]